MAEQVEEERDPEASMSLLQALLYDPLNYGFSAVQKPGKHKLRPLETVGVLILAIVLAFGATIAAKNLIFEKSETEEVVSNLREQVERQQKVVNQIEVENSENAALIALLSSNERGEIVSNEPAFRVAQLEAIQGPGLTVYMSEKENADALQRVLDTDLRYVINALWAGGAEGVELNGIRIGPTTAVRTAGGVVLVNFEPVMAPYEIRAIGDGDALERELKSGEVGAYLSTLASKYGIATNVSREDDIVLRPASVRSTTLTQNAKQE